MKLLKPYIPFILLVLISSCDDGFKNDVINEEITINEITDVVEILEINGVNHIYAQNQYDLFFLRYLAAKNFFLYVQATGTIAEILGEDL